MRSFLTFLIEAQATRDQFERAMWQIVDAKIYRFYGLRADNHHTPLVVGQVAPLSQDWSDKKWPFTLGGTSAIDVKDWAHLIDYSGRDFVLLGSNDAWPGSDTSELVMQKAVVLAVWHESDLVQPFWCP